jgi:signal transduction histidine kinase
MLHRGNGLGVLAAFDKGAELGPFDSEDEQLLRTFATSAAQAVALNRSVEADRLRSTIAAADAERSRWARELHDQTLQSLGGLRVALSSIVGRGDEASRDAAIRQAIEDIELEIANLRGIITDLRPSMLDDLGLQPAIEALLDRRRDAGLEIVSDLRLEEARSDAGGLDPQLETTIYRLVQESLTNIVKHAQANRVQVAVAAGDGAVTVEVQDDGVGFDPDTHTDGFGLAGMRERVYIAGGTVDVTSGEGGTLVRARLPQRAPESAAVAGSRRAAS